jgi:hypothetical protein
VVAAYGAIVFATMTLDARNDEGWVVQAMRFVLRDQAYYAWFRQMLSDIDPNMAPYSFPRLHGSRLDLIVARCDVHPPDGVERWESQLVRLRQLNRHPRCGAWNDSICNCTDAITTLQYGGRVLLIVFVTHHGHTSVVGGQKNDGNKLLERDGVHFGHSALTHSTHSLFSRKSRTHQSKQMVQGGRWNLMTKVAMEELVQLRMDVVNSRMRYGSSQSFATSTIMYL